MLSRNEAKRYRKDIRNSDECDYCPKLIKSIISSTPETQTWNAWNSKKTVVLVPLKTATKEYQLTAQRFCKTFNPNIRYEVILIERIENPYLMAGFVLKREEMRAMWPKKHVNTRTMFHATSRKNTESIIRDNFDWRLAGQSRGEKWGHGINFSPHSDFAAFFTKSDNNNGVCCMLMCLMLQRNTTTGEPGLMVPDDEYDTTKSKDSKVYVKYDDYTTYPAYRITYRKFGKTWFKK